MVYLLLVLFMGINFVISWHNSVVVGRMWSESKVIGGSVRVLAVAGYIMAICGFTMVYGCLLLFAVPFIMPLIPALSEIPAEEVWALASDMLYILIAAFIIPSGFIIWFNSVVSFWRRKTIAGGVVAGWNTYAQIRNTVNVARNMPGAFSRVTKALFGGKGKKKGNAVLVLVAVFIVILAVCGGWMTASAIMKKADREYDGFAEVREAIEG